MDNILATADTTNHNAEADLAPNLNGTYDVTCPSCGNLGDHIDYNSAAVHADAHATGDAANGLEAA